jgi:hypothetical protein
MILISFRCDKCGRLSQAEPYKGEHVAIIRTRDRLYRDGWRLGKNGGEDGDDYCPECTPSGTVSDA